MNAPNNTPDGPKPSQPPYKYSLTLSTAAPLERRRRVRLPRVLHRQPVASNRMLGHGRGSGSQASAALQPPSRLRSVLSTTFAIIFVTAAASFVYPLLPEVQYRARQAVAANPVVDASSSATAAASTPASAAQTSSNNRLTIPKIGVSTPILEAPSLAILDKEEGVWHQTGDIVNGNFVLAGHRFKYLPPNTSTLYNLDKIQPGDTIVVDWFGKRLVYVVTQTKTVPATAIDILRPGPKPELTIYTCSDVGETHRVVVVADPLP